MTEERWARMKDLFEAALERDPADRDSYLARACSGDPEMLSELQDLLRHHSAASNILDKPEWPAEALQVFSPGQLVANRYLIEKLLGSGGIGEVYEALDRELGERIALKTLRPEFSFDHRNIERLLQEIHLARRVTHPNVCRVYDLARHSQPPDREILFLTMELLRGETLADRIHRAGPIPLPEGRAIAAQLCAALQAAHANGIVHRDFKAGNVMLVEAPQGPRAMVMDFGLARAALDADSKSLTQTGLVVGTLAYMAPELLRGGEATPRSDIYALGVVLHEMASGKKPPPPDKQTESQFGALADPRWRRVTLRCLAADPKRRFESTADVAAALQSHVTPFPSVPLTRRGVLTAGAGIGAVALSAAAFRLFDRSAAIRQGSPVLLTEIENLTGEPELDAATDILRTQLSQSGHFRVVDRSRVKQVLAEMGRVYSLNITEQTAREIAWRAHSPLAVFGSISRLGESFVLNLKMERIDDRPVAGREWTRSFSAPDKPAMLGAIDAGSRWIRQMSGEAPAKTGVQDRPARETTTPSWQALLFYSQAERLKTIDQTEEAIAKLKKAVEADPDFALAWMRLGDLFRSLDRDNDGYRCWAKAVDATRVRPLTDRERWRIRGLFAADSWDFPNAIESFRTLEVLYPRDYLPTFYLASALIDTGKNAEGLAKLDEAARKDPSAYVVPARAARLNLVMGRYEAIPADRDRLRSLNHGDTADLVEACAAFCKGEWDRAGSMLENLLASADPAFRSRAIHIRACFLAERGRYEESAALLNQGVEFDRTHGFDSARAGKLLALSYLALRGGKLDQARDRCLAAIDIEHGVRRLVNGVSILAECGALKDAAELAGRLEVPIDAPVFESARRRIQGELMVARNQAAAGVNELRRARDLMPPVENPAFLARGLAAANQMREAETVYRINVEAPARIWNAPDREHPGCWADCLLAYGRAAAANGNAAVARGALEKFIAIRDTADPGAPGPVQAWAVLSRLSN